MSCNVDILQGPFEEVKELRGTDVRPLIPIFSRDYNKLIEQLNELYLTDGTVRRIKRVAGETIAAERAVVIMSDKLYLFQKTNPAHAGKCIGISENAGVAGEEITVIRSGVICTKQNLVNGSLYFGHNNGILSNAVPLGVIQPVGIAVEKNKFLVQIQNSFNIPTVQLVEEYTAGEIMSAERVVMLSGGKAYLFDPTDENNYNKAIGFSLNSVIVNDIVTVLKVGNVVGGLVLVPDTLYYAGPNGTITATPPSTGVIVTVGTALDANTLVVDIQQSIIGI
jgi:hypothetical protein